MPKLDTKLELEQGRSFGFTVTYTDPNMTESDWLNACQVKMQLRQLYKDPNPAITLSNATGEIKFLPGLILAVKLTPDQTKVIPVNLADVTSIPPKTRYVFDMELTYPDGREENIVRGYIDVYGTVTR
jgi:hypothetical protein